MLCQTFSCIYPDGFSSAFWSYMGGFAIHTNPLGTARHHTYTHATFGCVSNYQKFLNINAISINYTHTYSQFCVFLAHATFRFSLISSFFPYIRTTSNNGYFIYLATDASNLALHSNKMFVYLRAQFCATREITL